MTLRWVVCVLGLFFALTIFVPEAESQDRLRIAWAGGASNAAVWIVQDKALLKKQGINAEFISVNASPMALQAMLAGELDVIVTAVTTLVNLRLTGADVVMIASIVPTFPAHIVTAKDIAAVTLAALSKGLVQFAILVEPFVREAEKLGCKSPVDVSRLNIPFHWNAALTREATLRSKGPLIAKFVRALAEAIHVFKTDKESTLKIISKFTRITNPDSLARTHQAFAKILPENPSPSQEGVKTYLDYLAATRPEAAKANPKEFVDLSFSQELKASGYSK